MSELSYASASLFLDTRLIQTADGGAWAANLNNLDNSRGTISDFGQTQVYKQIDWSLVLGELRNQYRVFNMRVASYTISTGTAAQNTPEFGGVNCFISFPNGGARLVNQTYDVGSGMLSNRTPLFSGSLANGTPNSLGGVNNISSNQVTFSPGTTRYSDIRLEFRNGRTATGITNTLIGHVAIILDILPVLDSKI